MPALFSDPPISVGDLFQQIGETVVGWAGEGWSRSSEPRVTTRPLPMGLYVAVGRTFDGMLVLWQTREEGQEVRGRWWILSVDESKRLRGL